MNATPPDAVKFGLAGSAWRGYRAGMTLRPDPPPDPMYPGYRFPAEVISCAVYL